MNEHLRMVREFHDAFSYPQAPHGVDTPLTTSQSIFRVGLIAEEYSELLKALSINDDEQVLDALVDMAYFALGTLAMKGCDVTPLTSKVLPYMLDISIDRAITRYFGLYVHLISEGVLYKDPLCDERLSEFYYLIQEILAKLVFHDFDGAFQEVHDSNMSKLGADGKPIYSPEGKILKGPNYKAPYLKPFLNAFSHSEKAET